MNAQHTPGPWFTCHSPYEEQVCSKPEYDKARAAGMDDETACGESLICETAGNVENARLIAAAPALLEALNEVELRTTQARIASTIGKKSGKDDFLRNELDRIGKFARAAIAQATGE